jgi:hypothetical protein
MKRKIAQAVNHIANAVLDLEDVREEFKEAHPEHAEYLATIQINLATMREKSIQFAALAWELDETALMRWL